jgi:hypothetical protein
VALGECKADVAATVERQEKDPVCFSFQKTAQADVEVLLVASDGATDGWVDDKSDALALTDLFDALETQHG